MKKHNLKIRRVDKIVFDSIRNEEKTIETRANTDKYQKIKKDDVLVFICGSEKIEKRVKSVRTFENIDELTKSIDFKKIMPFVDSIEEMKKVYYGFPKYKEKFDKFGIVAWDLI